MIINADHDGHDHLTDNDDEPKDAADEEEEGDADTDDDDDADNDDFDRLLAVGLPVVVTILSTISLIAHRPRRRTPHQSPLPCTFVVSDIYRNVSY